MVWQKKKKHYRNCTNQNMQNIVLINRPNSRTAWPTKIFNAIFEIVRQFAS